MPHASFRRRARLHVSFLSLILLAACNGGGGNSFPEDPVDTTVPGETQTGTTTPTTDPPAPIPPPPTTPPPTGPDTEAPRVQMLLPTQNEALTGTVAVMADATDNVGVSSVQFLVDNSSIGAPDTASPYWLQFDTSYLSDGTHSFSARATDAAGNRATATARSVSVSNSCKTASPSLTPWHNTSFNVSGATFTVQWDATPLEAGLDAALGLSRGNATSFTSLATAVRFNRNNTIDVRNGGTYSAETTISYQPNQTFRIRMEVNLVTHTYSVFVSSNGDADRALATNFDFRNEQQGVSTLDRWAVGTARGALRVCGMSVAGNAPPVANAGADQTVIEGIQVTLDGRASSDSDGIIVSYAWRQIAGSSVMLTGETTAIASFTAPQVLFGRVLEFQLTVTDNRGAIDTDTVRITVENAAPTNTAPTANAGVDQNQPAGAAVTLFGSGSDTDGTIVAYAWSQTAGVPTIALTGTNTRTATFTAPDVPADTTFAFQLTVTDNDGATGSDSVDVLVRASVINSPPVADAGPPFSVTEGQPVTLAGTGSDVDGTIVSFSWVQTAGPVVALTNPDAQAVSFIAPLVDADTVLTFQLTVTDNGGATDATSVSVGVLDTI